MGVVEVAERGTEEEMRGPGVHRVKRGERAVGRGRSREEVQRRKKSYDGGMVGGAKS